MRIAFSVSLLSLACCAHAGSAYQSVPLQGGGFVAYSSGKAETRLEIQTRDGKRRAISLQRDSTVSPSAPTTGIKVVGEIDSSVLILVDTYPSVPGGMSYCQAGEEQFLRVISLASGPLRETLRVKTASCRQNLELTAPGIEWVPGSRLVRIHWLLGPGGSGAPEAREIRLGPDGRPLAG